MQFRDSKPLGIPNPLAMITVNVERSLNHHQGVIKAIFAVVFTIYEKSSSNWRKGSEVYHNYQEMWSRITNALKNHATSNKGEQQSTVMTKVFEQHPNLSIFHPNESGVLHPSPPPSPSVHSKGNLFKRMSKGASKDDADSQLAPSPAPFKLTSTFSKKVKNSLNHPNSKCRGNVS